MIITDATLCNKFWRYHSSTYCGYQLGLYKGSIHVKQIFGSAFFNLYLVFAGLLENIRYKYPRLFTQVPTVQAYPKKMYLKSNVPGARAWPGANHK